MNLALNIADDFGLVVDGLAQVSVDGNDVPNALRRAVTTKEAAKSGGKYLTSDTVFHLDIAQQEDRPAIGGQLTDQDDETWTILEVAKQTLSNRWRCICRLLWIDPSFKVKILLATYAKGDTGAQEPTWSTQANDVVAKIQIESEKSTVDHNQQTSIQRAIVFFASPITLHTNNRIEGPGGELLKVIQWNGFDPVHTLFSATCEVSKWPQA